MAEDKLAEIYQQFVTAREHRDEAMENLDSAVSAVKAANSEYNSAVSALADYLGEQDTGEGGDAGDIFNTIGGGSLGFIGKISSNPFGDLF